MNKNKDGLFDAAAELLGILDEAMWMNDYCGLQVSKHDEPAVTEAIEKLRAEVVRAREST